MDQQYRTAGNIFVLICLSFCSLLCTGLGIGFLFAYPDDIWWVGLMLLGSGVLLLRGGIKTYRSGRTEYQSSQRLMQTLSQSGKRYKPINAPVEEMEDTKVLAHWTYAPAEWQQFMRWERKEKKWSIFFESLVVCVFGTLILIWSRGASLTLALTICAAFALFYGCFKYHLHIRSLQGVRHQLPAVIITPEAVLINGKLNRFWGENLWPGKVDIKEANFGNVLEITYCWNTRKGKTFDELRIPIPKGRLREAVMVQQKLMGAVTLS